MQHHSLVSHQPRLNTGITTYPERKTGAPHMLHILAESQAYILGVKATGEFSHQEYQELLIPRLEAIIKEHGRARLLFFLDEDYQGFDLEALVSDPFGHEHKNDFQKIAVVGGSWWLSLQMNLITPFMAGEVRNFSRSELSEAWTWIRG